MATIPDDVYTAAMRRMYPDPTAVCTFDDMRDALALVYEAGRAAPAEGSKTQWGIRRIGFRSVRICSEQQARSLLRNWIVPGEIVTRHISPWEVR